MISAIKTAWSFYSAITLIILLMYIFIPGEILLNKTPVCSSLAETGENCLACGITHGFTSLTDGNFTKAREFNLNTMPVFLLFLINSVIFIIFISKKLHSKSIKIFNFKGNKLWQKQV